MKLCNLTIIITIFSFTACNGQKKETVKPSPSADWSKDAYMYAGQVIPKEIEYSGNNYEMMPIQLKSAVESKIDDRPVVVAICSVETPNKNQSAITYFLIDPQTGKSINNASVITIKGCDLNIPAFMFSDINKDKNDDFIFITSYNDKCTGDYWITSDIVIIGEVGLKNNLDDYLKLRNSVSINKKVSKLDAAELQKTLEKTVKELFNK